MSRSITGWKLVPGEQKALLERFAPRYPRVIADHITLRFGTDRDTPLPTATQGDIVGIADDGGGVQALVVRIDGVTERGDGSHFHISWSLAPGRRAKESNDVIAIYGWEAVVPPVRVCLEPAQWIS